MNLWALNGAPLALAVRDRLSMQRNQQTLFAAEHSLAGTSEGTGEARDAAPLRMTLLPRAALHDRPNGCADRDRISEPRFIHAVEVGND